MKHEVTIRYLEMTSPGDYRPARAASEPLDFDRVELPLPELNRFFYVAVGRLWHWGDRLPWPREKWLAWVDRAELETWVAYCRGTPVGYFELERQPEANVEVAYFGLLPDFTGRGFGGALLNRAIERAWEDGTRRVWLHTCTLDHPAALANYLARGFRQFDETTEMREPRDPAERAWYA
ncbi:MAG: GNAT family N-acetyltransferase [Planctomycetota bacterium]|nr:MAG: GNAT family N-acetyltransferase [Planctomycetota bacterium]